MSRTASGLKEPLADWRKPEIFQPPARRQTVAAAKLSHCRHYV